MTEMSYWVRGVERNGLRFSRMFRWRSTAEAFAQMIREAGGRAEVAEE